MKKTLLSVETLLSSMCILFILGAVALDDGLIISLILMLFLGFWQYVSGFIWVVAGDKRRVSYFILATIVLGCLFLNNESGLFKRHLVEMGNVGLMVISLLLGIWYIVITYRHYQSLPEPGEVLGDENGASKLL